MKNLLFLSFCLISACTSSPELKEGRWTGHLSPMNHPEMSIPISYDVTYTDRGLDLSITGSNDIPVKTQNPYIAADTLFFVFNEPEEQVPLECALVRQSSGAFSGKCIDTSGKWAQFTMESPD